MAHFHHRHAAAAPVEQFLADALENGKRQRPWTCVEIVDALGRAGTDGCLGHGVAFLFRLAFCGSSGRLAIIISFWLSRIADVADWRGTGRWGVTVDSRDRVPRGSGQGGIFAAQFAFSFDPNVRTSGSGRREKNTWLEGGPP